MNRTDASSGGAWADLIRALAFRYGWPRRKGEWVEVPLAGGQAALLSRRASRRLVTVLPSDLAMPGSATPVRGWLEKRQARRSRVLVSPDRATAVALALRWRLDPERFRLGSANRAPRGGNATSAGDGSPGTDAGPWYRL